MHGEAERPWCESCHDLFFLQLHHFFVACSFKGVDEDDAMVGCSGYIKSPKQPGSNLQAQRVEKHCSGTS